MTNRKGVDPDGRPSEAAMVRDPDQWPQWPVLPMKNREQREHGSPAIGFLQDTGIAEPVVLYHGNIFDGGRDDLATTVFQTVDDLLGAGWVVD